MTKYTLKPYNNDVNSPVCFWENDKGEQYGPCFPSKTNAIHVAGNPFLRKEYNMEDLHTDTCIVPLECLQTLLLTELDQIHNLPWIQYKK
ncbi:MAG: hypothetical protein ACKO37_08055 [Vampirovibrionales bacterium]